MQWTFLYWFAVWVYFVANNRNLTAELVLNVLCEFIALLVPTPIYCMWLLSTNLPMAIHNYFVDLVEEMYQKISTEYRHHERMYYYIMVLEILTFCEHNLNENQCRDLCLQQSFGS